jgi:ketosteroid isomerase-like protein
MTWERMDGVTAVADDLVAYLGRHWEDGWNREDTDLIVEPFAEDIVFTSPFASRLGDTAEVRGLPAVRDYVAQSFERATKGIRYTLHESFAGTNGVVLVYSVHRPGKPDQRGADVMRLDDDGKVVDWRCHYPFAE